MAETRKIDMSLPLATDEAKQVNNLLSMTAEGNIKGLIYGSATWDPASLIDGAGESVDITVGGVALGDVVLGVSLGVDIVDLFVTADVTAAGVVTARVQNESTGTVDLASSTVRVIVADVT